MVAKRRREARADGEPDDDEEFELVRQVLHLLEIKDTHHLSESVLLDILNHRKEFDSNLPAGWPDSFEGIISLLKRTGYMDPADNIYRICAGAKHATIFYPEG